ncbi:unnamed protein product [Cuscuta epithymum]|uniref:Reverse transcriptase zinc-binding domain-containing protein n=1 Tax=Cuscuta epithymum TaxID=186058 RepID=A0AAV0FXR9_9ASTE|nr:unnamed protein product [Cuscuta epithymum]CAH9140472.1 unnamed protein product [Cuscuta epithymum]
MYKFWWTGSSGRGIKWKEWAGMSSPKSKGGMGFRKLKEFNLAMIGKQVWDFMQNRNSLEASVFRARYFSKNSFLEAKVGHNPSFIWRSLWEAKGMVKKGFRWRVGDGSLIKG